MELFNNFELLIKKSGNPVPASSARASGWRLPDQLGRESLNLQWPRNPRLPAQSLPSSRVDDRAPVGDPNFHFHHALQGNTSGLKLLPIALFERASFDHRIDILEDVGAKAVAELLLAAMTETA